MSWQARIEHTTERIDLIRLRLRAERSRRRVLPVRLLSAPVNDVDDTHAALAGHPLCCDCDNCLNGDHKQ